MMPCCLELQLSQRSAQMPAHSTLPPFKGTWEPVAVYSILYYNIWYVAYCLWAELPGISQGMLSEMLADSIYISSHCLFWS